MAVQFDHHVMHEEFIVDQIFSGPKRIRALAIELSEEEIKLRGPIDQVIEDSRYVWLEFGLGQDPRKIRALGEIIDMGPDSRTVRFKHIFPDHRELLHDYLEHQTEN